MTMPKMPNRTIDLTGQTFGRLLVLAYAGRRNNRTYWRCKCLACGAVGDYLASNLGRCLAGHRGCPAKRSSTRGRPGYHSWWRIKQAGKVCKRWRSFENFIADMGEPPKGKRFLMRIEGTAPYKPGNCRWSSGSKPRILTYNGRAMPLKEWAREIGLSRQALYERLKTMPLGEALTRPAQKRLTARNME